MNKQNLFFLTSPHLISCTPVGQFLHWCTVAYCVVERDIFEDILFLSASESTSAENKTTTISLDDEMRNFFQLWALKKLSFLYLKTTLSSPRTIHDSKCFCLKPKVCYFLAFLPAACLFVSIMNQD